MSYLKNVIISEVLKKKPFDIMSERKTTPKTHTHTHKMGLSTFDDKSGMSIYSILITI